MAGRCWLDRYGVVSKVSRNMNEDDREMERIKNMTADEVAEELKARGIDTTKAVSHVLQMVREAKRRQELRRRELN